MKRASAVLAVLVLAGCGGAARVAPRQPHLPRALARLWSAHAGAIASELAAGETCTARDHALALQAAVIQAVNARRIAPRFQESLVAAVNDLAARITCVVPRAPAPPPSPHGHPKPPKPPKPHGKHGK